MYAECKALVVKANWSCRYEIFFLALPFYFCLLKSEIYVKKKTVAAKATAFGVKAFSVSFFLSAECVSQIKL